MATQRSDSRTDRKYRQITEDSTQNVKAATSNGFRSENNTTTRNLTSATTQERTSTQKANVACVISFSVGIIGRFPTKPGMSNC
jgi:hypothetical protein